MTNVVELFPANPGDDPDVVLESAKERYRDVIVLGWNYDDELELRMSDDFTKAEINYLMDKVKHLMLGMYDG